jgi:hypothetical protein
MRIRKALAFFSVCIIMAILLSGCLGVKPPVPPSSAPPSVFVDFQRTGGIAGVNDRVVIFDNGITVISGRMVNTELTLNQTELERISTLFSESKFSTLEGNYTSWRGGADLMQYRISYHGKVVQTEDTATPSVLQPIIEEMNRIMTIAMNNMQTSSPLPKITP